MTEHDLNQLATRERVTLRRYERNSRLYWYACVRHQGKLNSVYLCADTRLSAFSEADFLCKVWTLPGRNQKEHLDIQALPGASLQVSKGNRALVLTYEDVFEIAQWIGQQKGVGL